MQVKIGEKYYINCDQFCYWISRKHEVKSGKGAGEIVERRVSGYTATFEQAVDSFIERHIKIAEISDFCDEFVLPKICKQYEDLEEQGKLLKLPCAIGDQVFIVWHKFKHGKYEGGIYVGRFRLSDIAELGHTVFATREEAEVRLKEMKQRIEREDGERNE